MRNPAILAAVCAALLTAGCIDEDFSGLEIPTDDWNVVRIAASNGASWDIGAGEILKSGTLNLLKSESDGRFVGTFHAVQRCTILDGVFAPADCSTPDPQPFASGSFTADSLVFTIPMKMGGGQPDWVWNIRAEVDGDTVRGTVTAPRAGVTYAGEILLVRP